MKSFSKKIVKINLLLIIALYILGSSFQVNAAQKMRVKNLIEDENLEIIVGETEKLEIKFEKNNEMISLILVDENGKETTMSLTEEELNEKPTWSSDNEEVAVVDDGIITAKAEGTATIRGSIYMEFEEDDEYNYNFFDECVITVVSEKEEQENYNEEMEDDNYDEDVSSEEENEEGDASKLQPVKAETPKYGNGDLVKVGEYIRMTDRHWHHHLYINDSDAKVKNEILYSDNLTYKVEAISNINKVKISYQGKDIGYIFWINSPVYFEKVDGPAENEHAKDFVDINTLKEEENSSSIFKGGILDKIKTIITKVIKFIIEKLLPGIVNLIKK